MVIGLKQVSVKWQPSTQSFYRKSFIVTLRASRLKKKALFDIFRKCPLANVQDCTLLQDKTLVRNKAI